MAIYKAGTLSVTENSTTVTGQGTAFTITGVAGGLLVLGGVSALIASVESETSLTLSQPWAGDTQEGAEYSISLVAAEAASTVAASARITALVADIADQINLIDPSDFASGDVDGNAQNALQLGGRPSAEFVGAIDHAALTNNPHSVTKEQVGLGSVNNTTDADKPISTAMQNALDDVASATQGALEEITSDTQTALDGKASAQHNHPTDDIDGFAGAVQGILGTSLGAGENIDIQYDEETGVATITGEAGGGGDLLNPTVFGDYPSENLGRWDRIARWSFASTPFDRLSAVALVHCRGVSTVYTLTIAAGAGAGGVVNEAAITITSNASSFENGDRFLLVRDQGSNSIGLYYSRTEQAFRARFLNILSSHNGVNNEITLDKTIVEGQGTQAPSGNQSILITGPSGAISANPFVVFDGTNGNIIHSNKIQSLTRTDQGRYTVDFKDGTWNSANYMGAGSAAKHDSNHDGNISLQVGGASGVAQSQSRTFIVVGLKSNAARQDSPLVGVMFFGDLSETADNTQAVATVINNTGGATIDPAIPAHLNATDNPHSVTKEQVGLGSVDNTSDADKPISTATQAALDGKAGVDHTHSIGDIDGFDNSVQSILGASLVGGDNIDIQYDEGTGITTITGDGGAGGSTGDSAQSLAPITPDADNGRVGVNVAEPQHAVHVHKTQDDRLSAALAMTGEATSGGSPVDDEGVGIFLTGNVSPQNRQFSILTTDTNVGLRTVIAGQLIILDGFSNGARRDLQLGSNTNGVHVSTAMLNTQFSVSNHTGDVNKTVMEIGGHANQAGSLARFSTWHFGASGDALDIKGDGSAVFGYSVRFANQTVADAPDPVSAGAGSQIYVSDGDNGSPCLAISDGSTWRRVPLGATISAT